MPDSTTGRVRITYTNWRGETRSRVILPQALLWGETRQHQGFQWILWAKDPEDGDVVKGFAMGGITKWEPAEPPDGD